MTNIIDFEKYKENLDGDPGKFEAWLETVGADDKLKEFALSRCEELFAESKNIGKYNFNINLTGPLSEEDHLALKKGVQEGIENMKSVTTKHAASLIGRLLLAEMKLFQYERNT